MKVVTFSLFFYYNGVYPPQALCPQEDQWRISLNMALVLDEIWHLRNRTTYQETQIDILDSTKQIQFKFQEFST